MSPHAGLPGAADPGEGQFAAALARGEVDRFLSGEAPYFVEARNEHEEPQNVMAAFERGVLPSWRRTRDPRIPAALAAGLLQLLREHPDANRAVHVVSSWIWCDRWVRAQARGEVFELDLAPVAAALKAVSSANRQSLANDRRWAGAAWNSPDGLWSPLLRTARAVRDQLGGPDFVPDGS